MIEFGWGDFEKTYRVISFKGKWTLDEFSEMVNSLDSIRKFKKQVNFLIDLRYSHTPPMNIMGIMIRTIANKPQNIGQIIVISESNIWKRLYGVIALNRKDLSLNISFVRSVDKAYKSLIAETGGS